MSEAAEHVEQARLTFTAIYRDILLCRRPPIVCVYGPANSGKTWFIDELLNQYTGSLFNFTLYLNEPIRPETLQLDECPFLILDSWEAIPTGLNLDNVYADCKAAGGILILLGRKLSVLGQCGLSIPEHTAILSLEECGESMEPSRRWWQSMWAALGKPVEAYNRLARFYADYWLSRKIDRMGANKA